MTIELVGLLVAAWLGNADATGKSPVTSWLPDVTFRPRERSVSNWRSEAAIHLESSYGTTLNILLGRDPAQVSRCVRLNNYWCIKRAGWAGEIAADADGHVAFASAAEGADVAALLLRRYYVDYGRHSALAVVSHWAPASCGFASAATGRPPGLRKASGTSVKAAAADHLALHGIGHTLRARFLASRGHRMAGGRTARPHRSVIPDRLIGTAMRAPSIAVGLGEKPVNLGMRSLASISLGALGAAPSNAMGSAPSTHLAYADLTCVGDGARIQNYAAKTAVGVAANTTEDLRLFDASGRPTPNLARVMHNMSAVEVGPLGASKALIAAAVGRTTALAAQKTPAPVANR